MSYVQRELVKAIIAERQREADRGRLARRAWTGSSADASRRGLGARARSRGAIAAAVVSRAAASLAEALAEGAPLDVPDRPGAASTGC